MQKLDPKYGYFYLYYANTFIIFYMRNGELKDAWSH